MTGARRLAVTRLTVTQFRNHAQLRLEPGTASVALVGPNGVGKTNLLEAVSLLVPGRGLRHAPAADLPLQPPLSPGRWGIAAVALGAEGEVEVAVGASADPAQTARVVRIDGAAASQAALSRHLAMLWLTPAMDRLFVEGPAGRRRFLDRLVFAFDPAHAGRITRHDGALRQRARLLRLGNADPVWLDVLEAGLAADGVAIAAARAGLVRRLDRAATLDPDPAFPAMTLAVEGVLDTWLEAGSARMSEERLRAALAAGRAEDAARGGAGVGPQRSDLIVRHGDHGRPAGLCSTGEQKALLIGLVLAAARLLAAERGLAPVLLLDEVAAHLDGTRRAALFRRLHNLGSQAWMTATEAAACAGSLPDLRIFSLSAGGVALA